MGNKDLDLETLTAFKRLTVSFESKEGCLYFLENRSLIIDLLPTKFDSKTLYRKEETTEN
jgi:hypothetical protein